MALITCSKCGKRVSDKAKACPHCGSPVKLADSEPVQEEILRNQEPIHQSQSEAESRHLHESQPKPQLQAEPTHDQDDEPKKGKGGLVAILVVALLVLLAGAGWLWYDNSQKQAEMEQQLAIQREQARQDSIAVAELREQARQDSIAEAMHQQLIDKNRQSYIDVLRGYINKYGVDEYVYWGYFLYDITQDGVPELWVKAGTCEADNMTYIYTLKDGVALKVDEIGTFHSSIHRGDKYILVCMAYMGGAQWNKITFDGSKIKEKVIFEEDGVDNDTKFYTHCSEPEVTMYRFDDYSPINEAFR